MATFEELTGLSTSEEISRPLTTIPDTGAEQRREQGEAEAARDEETGIRDTLSAAFQRNITPMLYDTVQRKWSNLPEEGFDPSAWVTENKDSLPGQNLEEFATVRSSAEAEELRADMLRAQDNDLTVASKGYGGVAASLLVGIADPAEIAIAIGTGGVGKAASVAGRIARTGYAGLKGGVASGAVMNSVDPLSDTKQIVYGGLSGALMSSGLSAASSRFNGAAQATRRNFAAEVDDLPPADRQHVDAPVYNMTDNSQSLGAAAVNPTTPTTVPHTIHQGILDQSLKTIRDNNLALRAEDTDFTANTPEARGAKRFSDALSTHSLDGVKVDFDRMMYSGSKVEAAMAFNLLESPDGRIRNNRSGAMLKETYEQRLSSHSLPALDDSFSEWAGQRGMGVLDRHRPSSRTAFDREIFEEMEARYHGDANLSTDPAIKKAADALDRGMADALEVAKGRNGELSVEGFDDIQQKSGYMRHKWNGAAIRKAEAAGHSRASIESLLETGFRQSNPTMLPEHSNMLAKAVLRRAIAKEDGIDTNMLATLDSDAQVYLRELLTDSGYSNDVIDKLIESIRGKKSEQGQLSASKERVKVDLRTNANGLSLIDLVDTNMTRLVSQYNREIAGSAALARKGIRNRAQRKDMIEAAIAERREAGLPAGEPQRKFLEDVFTYFDSGPIGGGVDPTVSRAKRLTNLALLNQMGMTQAGEAGAQIAAVGMDTWKKHAAGVYREMAKQGPTGPIANELRPWMGNLGQEHLLFRDDLMLDELSSTRDLNTFLGKLDFGLGKGQRLQGYASGFYGVKSFQQKVAVMSMADKTMQRLRDGQDLDVLASVGMDTKALSKYVNNGTVTFDAGGFVDRLNMDQWSSTDAEDFAIALNRHTHQVVQKALAGEETMFMHKTVGSLYMHLKSFPILAMRKQSARLAGVQRPQFVAALVMGLATAGLAYEARQLINGRTERISAEDALKGAMGMSNMTGWIPMLSDPVASILGMEDLRFNQYGRHDISTGILSVPPVIPTLNRMAKLPGAVNPWADLSESERIRIMQTTPLVGNLYGFSAMFNAMK